MRQRKINVKPRTEVQLKHDVQHVYEATVEVVDAVYWSAVLPALDPKLKYTTTQKEDILKCVRQIWHELKSDMKQVQRAKDHSDEIFVAAAVSAAMAIGIEFDKIVDWFFEEWFALENNFWLATNARASVHPSGAIMILLDTPIKDGSWTFSMLENQVRERWKHKDGRLFGESPLNYPIVIHVTEAEGRHSGRVSFPTDWPLEGETLSPELAVPGLLSISPARDSAVTRELMAAYEIGVEILHLACPNYIAWGPTEGHMMQVRKLCNLHNIRQQIHQATQAALGRNAE